MRRPGPEPAAGPTVREPGGDVVGAFADLAEARRFAYRLLGQLFLDPDEERAATLAAAASVLRRSTDVFQEFAFLGAWETLLDSVESLGGDALSAIRAEHAELFVVGSGPGACPPYESAYMRLATRGAGWVAANLEAAYAAAGFAIPGTGVLPDGAATELEFLSLLCDKEAEAWAAGRTTDAVWCLEAQARLLDDHLMRWFPIFARKVARARPGGFYAEVAQTVVAFAGHDRDLIRSLRQIAADDENDSEVKAR